RAPSSPSPRVPAKHSPFNTSNIRYRYKHSIVRKGIEICMRTNGLPLGHDAQQLDDKRRVELLHHRRLCTSSSSFLFSYFHYSSSNILLDYTVTFNESFVIVYTVLTGFSTNPFKLSPSCIYRNQPFPMPSYL